MIHKVDGNNYPVYTKQKSIDIPDTGEKFNLGSDRNSSPSETKTQREKETADKGKQQAERSGVRLELSSNDTGADDYITKPFSLMVLVSKVNALMKRLNGSANGASADFKNLMISGDIQINCQEMKACKDGKELRLSKKELQLLVYLWENAGRILSKEKILDHIWDVDGQFVDENTVTVNISRLKNKLGTDEISNVRGLGYLWTGNVTRT